MNAVRLHAPPIPARALPPALERFRPAPRRGVPFGIAALDALLPGGVPRGQLTGFDAPLGSGGTALVLALAESVLRGDEGVAVVDAARTLAPQAAAHLAALGRFWVIRPRGTESAWWCADVLLRTGAFGLVVVDQGPAPARALAVRLQRLAADRDAALVWRMGGETGGQRDRRTDGQRDRGAGGPWDRKTGGSGDRGTGGPGDRETGGSRDRGTGGPLGGYRPCALVLAVRADAGGFVPAAPGGPAWPGPRAVRVTVQKGGAPRAAEVTVGHELPHRLRPHWAVRDRRPGAGTRSLAGRGQRRRAAQPEWP